MRRLSLAFVSAQILLCVLIWAAGPAQAGGGLRPVDLGVMQYAYAVSTPVARATDINNFGQVLAISSVYPQQWFGASIWQPDQANSISGQLLDQKILVGTTPRNAGQINDAGEIASVGQLFTPAVPNSLSGSVRAWSATLPNRLGFAATGSASQLFRIDRDANQVLLDDASTIGDVAPWAINDAGQIAGYHLATSGLKPFLWTPDSPAAISGTMRQLPMPFSRHTDLEVFLNQRGEVVVTAVPWTLFPDTATATYLFRPGAPNSPDGTVLSLDDLLAEPNVQVMDLNNRGQMLAWFYEADGTVRGEWLLTPDDATGLYDRFRIDNLPAMQIDAQTFVRSFDMSALNDHDQLVGAAQWSFDGGMTWNARATMLIVPEPTAAATTLLAIACGVGLARRRRRSRTHFSGLISNPVASLG